MGKWIKLIQDSSLALTEYQFYEFKSGIDRNGINLQ